MSENEQVYLLSTIKFLSIQSQSTELNCHIGCLAAGPECKVSMFYQRTYKCEFSSVAPETQEVVEDDEDFVLMSVKEAKYIAQKEVSI